MIYIEIEIRRSAHGLEKYPTNLESLLNLYLRWISNVRESAYEQKSAGK
jgi:hypothetical protein